MNTDTTPNTWDILRDIRDFMLEKECTFYQALVGTRGKKGPSWTDALVQLEFLGVYNRKGHYLKWSNFEPYLIHCTKKDA